MKKVIYLYSGEGTRNRESSLKLIKTAPSWEAIKEIIQLELELSLEQMWQKSDIHSCPHSPLLTIVSQICLSEIWEQWGYRPNVVMGHSIGELTAAYRAGIYSLKDILLLTHRIGKVTARLKGGMVHGTLSEKEMETPPLSLAAKNFPLDSGLHVTLSGLDDELDEFLKSHPRFLKMQPPHPWHHRNYADLAADLEVPASGKVQDVLFVSGVTAGFERGLQDDHWSRWLTGEIDFNKGIEVIAEQFAEEDVDVIEIGFHPVLTQSCESFQSSTYASSMYRGEDEIKWILYQRSKLDQNPFRAKLDQVVDAFSAGVDYSAPLSYQGFTSLKFVEFAVLLEPLFPTLAPQDFYRYKTIDQLVDGFGRETTTAHGVSTGYQKNKVVIAGMSCKFPSAVENPVQFWDVLCSGQDQVKGDTTRGDFEAGFLSERTSRFDHKFFNISEAEAKTMDPQQILALELTEMLFRDAGLDPEQLDRKRVGVYIGAWNGEFPGDPSSVYYPTGTNPSIIASRISYHYDLRGPSWVVNTACSSSLVAIHYACKDIEAGRVDYAITGGVNMILGNDFTHAMRDSGFLSKDQRCKAFDDGANGYVRSEGGGLVLLTRKELSGEYYAEVLGSSINQNGGRAQVITAPHPEAQEELIVDACRDAGISPNELSYVECHGTGTKIGDPIEVSALQNSVCQGRNSDCLLGSVKSNIGHLESAAGIAGMLKSVLALYHQIVPGNLHFNRANQYIDFASHHLKVVTEDTPIEKDALVGVSSFGFGGANGHVILKGADAERQKQPIEQERPFNADRATPLAAFYELDKAQEGKVETGTSPVETKKVSVGDVKASVIDLFFQLTGIKEIDPDVDLTDQGLDSLSATQFITSLQGSLGVELDTDLLFDYPLIDQLVAHLGEIGSGSNIIEGKVNKEANGKEYNREAIAALVTGLFYELTNVKEIDPDVELTDQGLDSLSATEFLSRLGKQLKIEVDSDLLFDNPLFDQLVNEIYASLTQV